MATSCGGELRQRAFWVRFDRAAREAGLEDVSPHDLRHTAASLAVSAGGNLKAVQRMLGPAATSRRSPVALQVADLHERR